MSKIDLLWEINLLDKQGFFNHHHVSLESDIEDITRVLTLQKLDKENILVFQPEIIPVIVDNKLVFDIPQSNHLLTGFQFINTEEVKEVSIEMYADDFLVDKWEENINVQFYIPEISLSVHCKLTIKVSPVIPNCLLKLITKPKSAEYYREVMRKNNDFINWWTNGCV